MLDRVLVVLALGLAAGAWILAQRRARLAWTLAGFLATLLIVMLAARWVASGHPPVFGTFEMNLAQALMLLILTPWVRRAGGLDHFRAPIAAAFLTLAHTFLVRSEATPLTISELSLWIDLHAPLGWLTWALYIHATLVAFAPGAERLALRLLGYGFVAHSALAAVGAYYGTRLFGAPWSWDPVQSLWLLSWLLVALALHLRLFFQVSLYRQRYFVCVLLALYVLSAKLVMFLPAGQSFHVFELGAMAPGGP